MGASTNAVTVNLYITPVVIVDLEISPTYYDFSSIDLGTSTGSLTGLNVKVGDEGTVGIKLEKAVWGDDGWDVTLSSAVQDGFDLWAMTRTTWSVHPETGEYTTGNAHEFDETALFTYNNLTQYGSSTQMTLDINEETNLWLRLDMPFKATESRQQKLQVRVRASAK
jgi:hypothetical protein